MEWHPETAEEESTQLMRARAYLDEALQADSSEDKNYAIRSALQLLVTTKYNDNIEQAEVD